MCRLLRPVVWPTKLLGIYAGAVSWQAIATAHRLATVVAGLDVRGETREQTAPLGAEFLNTGISAEGEAWYARELTDKEHLLEQQVLDKHIAEAEVAITTFGVPGRPHRRLLIGPPWIG